MSDLPHIIIFNPDQWRSDAIGCNGNDLVHTPIIDNLVATEAVSFTNAYCQNPVCTPSRCSFMTGWYPHVRGHRTMVHMLHEERDEPNLLKVLKDNGYFVWWGGKNDLLPGQNGYERHCDILFDHEQYAADRGLTIQAGNHGGDLSWRGEKDGDNFYSFHKGKLEADQTGKYYDSDWAVVEGACDFIKNYKGEKPLCIYLALQYPHPPYCVEDPWFSQVNPSDINDIIDVNCDLTDKPVMIQGIRENQKMQDWDMQRWQQLRSCYYGMCGRVDSQFGILLDTLKDKGFYDDSAVFLFSDHGDFTGDYGLVEKTQNTFEDCISKVPFIIKPPANVNCQAGNRDCLTELIDFSATVYSLTGIDPNYTHFGSDLLPVIQGNATAVKEAAFCEGGRLEGEYQAMESTSNSFEDDSGFYYPRVSLQARDDKPWHTKAAMCRTLEYKYVRRHYEKDEFYDLKNDPQELHNLIDNPDYKSQILEHKDMMLTWYMHTADVVPYQLDERFFIK